jgi:CBS domain-containing protein
MKTTVKDVMTTRVMAVRRGAPYKEMAAKLRQFRISGFPVVDDDGLVAGVVSEADLLAKQAIDLAGGGVRARYGRMAGMISGQTHRGELQKTGGLTAGDLMTHPAVTVTPDEPVEHAVRLMYNCRVKRLPVVDADGRLVGIVSRADVLAVFDRPDEEILAEITDDIILDQLLLDPGRLIVTVADGVVTVRGNPEAAVLGHNLVEKIRHVPGVVAVRDELAYPPHEQSIPGQAHSR